MEYMQFTVEASEVQYLCATMLRNGWEPTFIFEAHRKTLVCTPHDPVKGEHRRGKRPYHVLFRNVRES